MTRSLEDVVWKGDITPEVKDGIRQFMEAGASRPTFAPSVSARAVPKEIEVFKREKDGKAQARVVYEMKVEDDMLNWGRNMHGGCAVYLIDICSSTALAVLALHAGKSWGYVSQALNTTFHAPAPAGVTIEIVNTTTSFGARTVSATTEIWDASNGRLCMTGVHNKMAPSKPKL